MVCPEGVCNGELNGHDMTRWNWASNEEVMALFGSYDSGNGCPTFVEAFFYDGWRKIQSSFSWSGGSASVDIIGLTSSSYGGAYVMDALRSDCGYFADGGLAGIFPIEGAWLYYAP